MTNDIIVDIFVDFYKKIPP